MNKSGIYYMEKDGAVKIPDKYKNMTYEEITAECARLANSVKSKRKATIKKPKMGCKTKFAI